MVLSSADVILFGIQAGVRLAGAARQSYIEKTRERDLVLPLPGLDHVPTVGAAESWFDTAGAHHLVHSERLRELHAMVHADRFGFEDKAALAQEYVEAYTLCRGIDSGKTQDGLTATDIMAVTRIAQWRTGQAPHPSALQRVGGTLVEIGIDYFANGPGKGHLSGNSSGKKVLASLLMALDDHEFATEGLEGVLETMFLAALSEVADRPELVSDDPHVHEFVGAVARGLVVDVEGRLAALPKGQRLLQSDHLASTAGLVFRSMIRHGTEHLLEDPSTLLGVDDEASQALVSNVGRAILDTVLPSSDSPIDLSALLGQAGIDKIVRSALEVVVQHPELMQLRGDAGSGVQVLLLEIAETLLEDARPIGIDLLPDLARLVLERTAGRLELFWDVDGDTEHVLMTAVRSVLSSLAEPPSEGGTWKPRFSRALVLDLAEAVLDEVAENPGMITDRVGSSVPLQAALDAALRALATVELDRVSTSTLTNIVGTAVRAAAQRLDFLDKFRIGAGSAKPAIAQILESVLAAAFPADGENARAAWTLSRADVLEAVVEAAFEELAEAGVDAAKIGILQEVLARMTARLENRQHFSLQDFAEELQDALAA